jgi:nickel/cobalt exporter
VTRRRLPAVLLAAAALWAVVPAGVASAHPLGNFTVNHYDHLELAPGEVRLTAIVDRAEIPTAQLLPSIAAGDVLTEAEAATAAEPECAEVGAAVQVSVDGRALEWRATGSTLETVPGAAGLPTLRLSCGFRAEADLDGESQVSAADTYLTDRVGWREMTAVGDGVALLDSPVPVASVSDELRTYPVDLLASPVDVRSFTVATRPGVTTGTGATIVPGSGDPFTDVVAGLDRRFEGLIGSDDLTVAVGALAVLLAVLLGCGHALLPGHGKTVMAAYLAARRGRSRDAVVVGATVTATHTVGVLVLGLAISVSSSLAGDQVIRWLGVASGLLVAGIGLSMLRGALRRRPAVGASAIDTVPEAVLVAAASGSSRDVARAAVPHTHPHGDHDHDHPHDGGHEHLHPHPHPDAGGHDHPHPHEHPHDGGHEHLHPHPHPDAGGHDHPHPHEHPHDGGHDHPHDHPHPHPHPHEGAHEHPHSRGSWWSGGHDHGPGGHTHGPGGHTHGPGSGRSGLVGMGIAGGLVPSPSALLVLLASIGLGRTVFGVVLVLAYGLGMAGTLTVVGLLLVKLRGRLERRVSVLGRSRALVAVVRLAPVLTASLVLLVGLSLAVRGALYGA